MELYSGDFAAIMNELHLICQLIPPRPAILSGFFCRMVASYKEEVGFSRT